MRKRENKTERVTIRYTKSEVASLLRLVKKQEMRTISRLIRALTTGKAA